MSAIDAQQRRADADPDLDAVVDRAVEDYEQARLAGAPGELSRFVPPVDHPAHGRVACELMRVDMEYAWEAGRRKGIEDYRDVFGTALALPDVVERVAFEEYRLRSHAGEGVVAADYRERYAIDTSRWPVLERPNGADDLGVSLGNAVSLDMVASRARAASADEGFPLAPGRFLDFELVLELGRGAFARVYLARQSELAERFVALKVSRSFSDEPQRLAQLQHTNIVPIYSVHHAGPLRAVCMPFFGGATLADLLAPLRGGDKLPTSGREFVSTLVAARQSTLVAAAEDRGSSAAHASGESGSATAPPVAADPTLLAGLERSSYVDAVLALGEQLTDGLAHAHQRGIVHRDLKPANVLVTDEGRAMLLDFNLAADADATAASRTLGGTLAYMPAELLDALVDDAPPAAADPRGDVFGVGVLLFEMLAGRLPFPAYQGLLRDTARCMAADRRAPLPSVRAINPGVPRAVEAIVRKCLSSDPAERYPSAVELHEDLRRQRENLPLLHVREPSLVERGTKWARRHPRIASATTVAAAAAVLLVASLGAWWYRGEEIARRDAATAAAEFHRNALAWRIPLGTHDLDAESRRETLAAVTDALAERGVLAGNDWRGSPDYGRLSPEDRRGFDLDAAELCYLAANAIHRSALPADEAQRRAELERALAINGAALAAVSHSHLIGANAPLERLLRRQRETLTASLDGGTLRSVPFAELAAPKSANDAYLVALERIAHGEFAAAADAAKPRVDADPQDYALRYALAQAYRGQGETLAAIDEFTACAALAPESHLAFFYRGLCRLEREDFRSARADFDEVLRRSPGLPAALINRAIARERLGDVPGAIADLSAALENGSQETRVYFLRARFHEKAGDTAAAERDRQEGFRLPARDEASFMARGVARLPSDATAALEEFRTALRHYPESAGVRRNIAHVLSERLNRPDEAIVELDAVIEQRPRDAAALVGRGVLHARRGQREVAHRDAQQALRTSRDGQTVYQAACVFALTSSDAPDDAATAMKLLAESLLLEPRTARIAATDADLRPLAEKTEFRRLLSAAAMLDRAISVEEKRP